MTIDNNANFAARRNVLRQRLSGASMLVSNLVNVRYLTGFSGSNAYLLISDSVEILLTDGRYVAQAAAESPDLKAKIRPVETTMEQFVVDAIKDAGTTSCFVESQAMSHAMWMDFVEKAAGSIAFGDSTGIVEELRAVKDDYELSQIRRSIEINEAAFKATIESFDHTWSEKELAWQLEREIRQRGGDGFSFDAIVGAGPSSALPHYHPSDVKISDHAFFLLDWGTSYQGYASDLTRMVSVSQPPEKIKEIHRIVADAKQAAIACVRDGALLTDVDGAARKLIADAGYGDQFGHGLGHGFGLEIHETPFMSPAFSGTLKTGMVITIEPGIYLPEIGGVRLEDDILVTPDGSERLNALTDDFFAV